MPTAYIKKLSKEGKGSVKRLEALWHKATAIAKTDDKEENFGYIIGIFKNMIGESKKSNI